MKLAYEWVVEEVDGAGDIQDVDHHDRAADAIAASRRPPPEGMHYEIGLVRDARDAHDDLAERQWAYAVGGVLPAAFDGGAPIPPRLRVEWEQANVLAARNR